MAEIRPFRGLRFNRRVVGDLADVMAPPYDVVDAAAQAEYYQRSFYNIIRLELGRQYPEDTPSNNRYTRAAAILHEWLQTRALQAERAPAIYVYQQSFIHHGRHLVRTGFLAAMRLEEWDKRIVLPHESTMSGPKADRLQLMRATAANFSPIFALYEDASSVAREVLARALAGPPTMSFAEGEEEHRLWVVADERAIADLSAVLRGGPVYIADGHHRYETALYYRNEQRAAHPDYSGDEACNFVMTLLVAADDPGLVVLPTHRLVNPKRLDWPEVDGAAGREAKLNDYFAIRPLAATGNRRADLEALLATMEREGRPGPGGASHHAFGAYGPRLGRFALLSPQSPDHLERLMPGSRAAAWRALDVSILHELVLRPTFGLAEHDFEDESRVAYTRDEQAALRAVDEGRYRLALFLNATPVRQVLAVARAGEVMPHKSTYFHPKPLTGLVLNRLTDVLK